MATDLISREALLEDLRESVNWLHKIYGDLKYEDEKRICGAEIASFSEVIMRVKDFPAVDAVEVVRCKDCENFWEYTEEHKATVENADGDCAIRKWRSDDEQFCAVTKDDYCSLARRKKDAVD